MRKLLAVIFIFASGAAFSQTNTELNGFIRQSLTYFPRIQELTKSEEVSALRVNVAESNFLPNINGTGSYSYVNPISQIAIPGADFKIPVQPYNNYNLNVGLNQTVWDFGKTRAQIEKSKTDLLVAHQNTASAKLQVAAQVATVYYSMIYLKKSIIVQDSVIAYYQEDKKIIDGKIKQGDALQIDLSTIENNIDQEENRKVEFARQYDRQASLLRYTTGQTGEPAQNEFDFGYTSGADFTNSPDVLAAMERIEAAKADVRLSSSNKYPSLTVQANAGYKNGYQPKLNDFRFNYLVGATLNIPIYQGGRLRQNAAIAKKSAELSEFSKNNTVTTLQKDIESVQSDLKAYEQQIKNSEGQIEVAKETFRLTKVRYKQGVATYLDLVSASTNLQRAYLNQLQYEYQRTLSLVENCRLTGVKFWQE